MRLRRTETTCRGLLATPRGVWFWLKLAPPLYEAGLAHPTPGALAPVACAPCRDEALGRSRGPHDLIDSKPSTIRSGTTRNRFKIVAYGSENSPREN